MPTTRPRYTVTESDELKSVLDEIARRNPALANDRNALFRRLVNDAVGQWARTDRRAAIDEVLDRIEARGLRYPPGYLADLRGEWPE